MNNKQARSLIHTVNLFENHTNKRFDKVHAEFKKVYERLDSMGKQISELSHRIDKLVLHFRYQTLMIGILLSLIVADGDLVPGLISKLFGR